MPWQLRATLLAKMQPLWTGCRFFRAPNSPAMNSFARKVNGERKSLGGHRTVPILPDPHGEGHSPVTLVIIALDQERSPIRIEAGVWDREYKSTSSLDRSAASA